MRTSATAARSARRKASNTGAAKRVDSADQTAVALGEPVQPMQRPTTQSNVGRLPGKIHRARDALIGQFRPILTAHGLTDSQWRVLRVLSNAGEIDAGDTARRAFLLPSSLSRILKDFNKRGLIVSWAHPADARRSMHALSDQGRQLVSAIDPHLLQVNLDLERRFGVERLRAIAKMLDAFSDELES